jgi:hypothetical protein
VGIIELSINNGQDIKMGDRIFLTIKGNFRPWIVCGWNAAKTSFLFMSTDTLGD